MNLASAIILLVITVYVVRITLWLYHWHKLPFFQPRDYSYVPVSVVVAFRNEANNIRHLIECLQNQQYPPHLLEVILVDDHSEDNSVQIIQGLINNAVNFKCIPNNVRPGKKGALITGIHAAANELIVTTDADAGISPDWIAITGSFYNRYEPALIMAPVNIKAGDSFIQRFFVADFISLIASGAGAAAAGKPVYCNGANMAFRKSAFLKYNDPMNIATVSGDDTFLLHAMKRNHEKIMFLKSFVALVEVKAPGDVPEFINQHVRWASKSRHYRDPDAILTAWLVFLANISLLAALILMPAGLNFRIFGLVYLLKAVADYRLLATFYGYFRRKIALWEMMLFELIYPVYLVTIFVTGFFAGYGWKGRRY